VQGWHVQGWHVQGWHVQGWHVQGWHVQGWHVQGWHVQAWPLHMNRTILHLDIHTQPHLTFLILLPSVMNTVL
jgi:hypothetical protein